MFRALGDDPEGADRYAAGVIRRSRLPAAERRRLKEERVQEYRGHYRIELPPTEKQLAFLRRLGCSGQPSCRSEASTWIDALLSGQQPVAVEDEQG